MVHTSAVNETHPQTTAMVLARFAEENRGMQFPCGEPVVLGDAELGLSLIRKKHGEGSIYLGTFTGRRADELQFNSWVCHLVDDTASSVAHGAIRRDGSIQMQLQDADIERSPDCHVEFSLKSIPSRPNAVAPPLVFLGVEPAQARPLRSAVAPPLWSCRLVSLVGTGDDHTSFLPLQKRPCEVRNGDLCLKIPVEDLEISVGGKSVALAVVRVYVAKEKDTPLGATKLVALRLSPDQPFRTARIPVDKLAPVGDIDLEKCDYKVQAIDGRKVRVSTEELKALRNQPSVARNQELCDRIDELIGVLESE